MFLQCMMKVYTFKGEAASDKLKKKINSLIHMSKKSAR